MNKIKDFFYDKSDIFFALIVICFATFIVGYNLNGWIFVDAEHNNYITSNTATTTPITENTDENTDENSIDEVIKVENEENTQNASNSSSENTVSNNENKANTSTTTTPSTSNTQNTATNQTNNSQSNTTSTQKATTTTTSTNSMKNITIPAGSTAKSIAKILKDNALISDEQAFLNTLTSTKSDTKLKAGNYQIKQGSSVNDIIKVLTK